jgi:hypothetical protein
MQIILEEARFFQVEKKKKTDGRTGDITKVTGGSCSYSKDSKIIRAIVKYKQLLVSETKFVDHSVTIKKTDRLFVRKSIIRCLISGFRVRLPIFKTGITFSTNKKGNEYRTYDRGTF